MALLTCGGAAESIRANAAETDPVGLFDEGSAMAAGPDRSPCRMGPTVPAALSDSMTAGCAIGAAGLPAPFAEEMTVLAADRRTPAGNCGAPGRAPETLTAGAGSGSLPSFLVSPRAVRPLRSVCEPASAAGFAPPLSLMALRSRERARAARQPAACGRRNSSPAFRSPGLRSSRSGQALPRAPAGPCCTPERSGQILPANSERPPAARPGAA
jgi:hypothetical protein